MSAETRALSNSAPNWLMLDTCTFRLVHRHDTGKTLDIEQGPETTTRLLFFYLRGHQVYVALDGVGGRLAEFFERCGAHRLGFPIRGLGGQHHVGEFQHQLRPWCPRGGVS